MPKYPGEFTGTIIHSRQYKSPKQVRDQRVLVVGCGNSAADILSDAAHGGSKVFLSIRRGYWFVPKFLLGFPTGDVVSTVEAIPLPRVVRRWLFQGALWMLQGPPSRYRLPDPDYAIDQAHPTMTDEVPRLVAHGSLTVKPEIASLAGNEVSFTDGSREAIDTIVFATGYEPVIPFVDEALIFAQNRRPRLLINIFHPEHPGLFVAGLAQANGSMWRLADYQAQLIANMIIAQARAPDLARRFRAHLAAMKSTGRTFVGSDRHRLEVNYFDYRRLLKRLLRRFGAVRRMAFMAGSAAAESSPHAMMANDQNSA
jgi:cation diffusion facilitator CzcD-associated flavoprotein CzcO